MTCRPRLAWALIAAVVLTVTPPVHAYLDPGTGSMIMAAVVAVFATLVMGVKTYWYKLTSLFRGKDKAPSPDRPDDRPRS